MKQAKLFEYGAGARIAFYVGFFFLFMLVVAINMGNSRQEREERQQAINRVLTPSVRETLEELGQKAKREVEIQEAREKARREAKIQAALDAIQHREPTPGALTQ